MSEDLEKRTALSIPLIYDRAAPSGDQAERDVLDQLDAVETALRHLGHRPSRLPVDMDLGRFKSRLTALKPDVVFNLVESLDLSDRLQTMVPLLLEDMRIPFTGSGSLAMLVSNHKIVSKRVLAAHGLPCPPCAELDRGGNLVFLPENAGDSLADQAWIIKAREAHASLHLDDSSIFVAKDRDDLAQRLAAASERFGQPFFAEHYIDGREFNLSVLETEPNRPQVLPAAEIVFDALPEGKPHIVGNVAKWEEDSCEYRSTPRRFAADAGSDDDALIRELNRLAVGVWSAMDLSGYARVDFRVDQSGGAWILEANSNPCLSPDAGLAAAAEEAGLDYRKLCETILRAALHFDPRFDA